MRFTTRFRGALSHSHDVSPYIVTTPPTQTRAPLETLLAPYRIRQAHLDDEPVDLAARRILDGWPANA